VTTIDPEQIARTAMLDQYRAESAADLDHLIAQYRAAAADGVDSNRIHSCFVMLFTRSIDPHNQMQGDQAEKLFLISETLAVAIDRLATASTFAEGRRVRVTRGEWAGRYGQIAKTYPNDRSPRLDVELDPPGRAEDPCEPLTICLPCADVEIDQ
jgi:hypothetical protein